MPAEGVRQLIIGVTVHIQQISDVYCLVTAVEGNILSSQTAPGSEHKELCRNYVE